MARGRALGSVFRAAIRASKPPPPAPVAVPWISASEDLKLRVSTIKACSTTKPSAKNSHSAAPSTTIAASSSSPTTNGSTETRKKGSIKTKQRPPSSSTLPDPREASDDVDSYTEHPTHWLARDIRAIMLGNAEGASVENSLDIHWFGTCTSTHIPKERSRQRKRTWILSTSQQYQVERIAKKCAEVFGSEETLSHVLGKLGRETGVKEYEALIKSCLEIARETEDYEIVSKQMSQCFHLLTKMKEQGFRIEENTYGPVLMYLIDMGMVQEFDSFLEAIKTAIKTENRSCLARLGYYEMLMYTRLGDE